MKLYGIVNKQYFENHLLNQELAIENIKETTFFGTWRSLNLFILNNKKKFANQNVVIFSFWWQEEQVAYLLNTFFSIDGNLPGIFFIENSIEIKFNNFLPDRFENQLNEINRFFMLKN